MKWLADKVRNFTIEREVFDAVQKNCLYFSEVCVMFEMHFNCFILKTLENLENNL